MMNKMIEEGALVKKFMTKNGRIITLRYPSINDLDAFLHFINGLVAEPTIKIGKVKKATREEEQLWLDRNITMVKEGRLVLIVAEVDGRIVGEVELRMGKEVNAHVANLGLALSSDYRHIGLGAEMIETIFEKARTLGIRIVTLRVFSNNEYAMRAYENVGFRTYGRLPQGIFKNGAFADEVYMYKAL